MKRWSTCELLVVLVATGMILSCKVDPAVRKPDVFSRQNLVAWCIVPFDSSMRGPEERARMLRELGLQKVAYDWRKKDIPTFDQEITALRENGIELSAFWCPVETSNPMQEESVAIILDLLKRREIKTQLWVSLNDDLLEAVEEPGRLEAAAKPIGILAEAAQEISCSIGLYNHGGWFGEPENQIAIIELLQRPNIGIVYNFHHGHDHLNRFNSLFLAMKPFLLAVNLNGMRVEGPKILTLGKGDRELEMMRIIVDSGYSGLIGILDHQSERDTREVLEENLLGLEALVLQLGN